jgi:hypothetical protein
MSFICCIAGDELLDSDSIAKQLNPTNVEGMDGVPIENIAFDDTVVNTTINLFRRIAQKGRCLDFI